MKTELYSVSKIFTERLLRIPDYQRGYAWTEKHLKDFWADLTQLEPEKNHYVGVLTLEEAPEHSLKTWVDDHWIISSKGYAPFHVVDGQQRLTTTIILIQSICEVVGDDEKLNFTSVPEIRKKFIYDSKDGGISRSYLFGYEKDNPSYDFLKAKIFNESDTVIQPLEETVYTTNLQSAKEYFVKRLSDYSINQIENVYKKITQNFLFAIYSMSDDIDVYITFETMNNRGKPLSHLELLKNRLIYLTTKFDECDTERQKLRKTINDCWRAIYHHLGRNKDQPLDDDVFLFNHFVLYFGKELLNDSSITLRKFRRGYRHNFREYLLEERFTVKAINSEESLSLGDVNDYVISLKTSVEVWYKILNPSSSEYSEEIKYWLGRMNRLGIMPFLPLIMTFFRECDEEAKCVQLLVALERFGFLVSLMRYHYYMDFDDAHFLDYANKISGKELSVDDVLKEIDARVDEIYSRRDLIKHINERTKSFEGYYGWDGIRYFLYEYEVYLKERSKTYSDKLDWEILSMDQRDYLTVEHIFPKKALKKCWTSEFSVFTTKERNILRNSLGNLCPLSKPKNSSLQNKCFDEKKSNSNNTVGYVYGCLSENEVAQNEKWGAEEILARGIKMLKFMEKRWQINIRDKEEMLGLKFLKKKHGIKKTY